MQQSYIISYLHRVPLKLCISQFHLRPVTPLPLGRLVSPWSGEFANVALPGRRVFANPRANPELLTRTRFSIRI